jgi:hypothetical protein
MIRILIAALAMLGAARALAHDCDPKEAAATGLQIGTPMRTVTTSAGEADVWWCQFTLPTTPAGMVQWRTQYIVRLAAWKDTAKVVAAAGRVVAASDSIAQLKAEFRAGWITVTPGTMEHYEVLRLRWVGCRNLVANPPPGTPPNWLKPADAPSAWVPTDWCGPAPVPPVITPPAGNYAVTLAQAYPLRADGTRSTTQWSIKPTTGEPCDCSVSLTQFTVRYCKVPRLSTAAQTVVAACAAKP